MNQPQVQVSRRPLSRPQWILFAFLVGIAAALAIRTVLASAERMHPAASPPGAAAIAASRDLKAVVRIDSVTGSAFTGTMLRRQSDTDYCLLPKGPDSEISVTFGPNSSIVMGQARDLTKRAVVQVAGLVDAAHVVEAKQIVILTGYIRVAEKPCQ
jgi:hypothetical protein